MTLFKLASTAAISIFTASAAQADQRLSVTQTTPSADACTRTIQAMGASMGYTAVPGEKPTFLFTVRVNGVDYSALCDAATGMVKDVSPKASH